MATHGKLTVNNVSRVIEPEDYPEIDDLFQLADKMMDWQLRRKHIFYMIHKGLDELSDTIPINPAINELDNEIVQRSYRAYRDHVNGISVLSTSTMIKNGLDCYLNEHSAEMLNLSNDFMDRINAEYMVFKRKIEHELSILKTLGV